MALENIITKILEDAEERAAAFKKGASLKANDAFKKAEEEAKALKEKTLTAAKEKAQLETERSYISKNLEIKKEILKKKRELVDLAFNGALKSILALDDKKYLDIIKKAIASYKKDDTEYEIQFSKQDANRINKDFLDDLNKKGLKPGEYMETDDHGFILKKDKIIIDFTFKKASEALKQKKEFEVAKMLFG